MKRIFYFRLILVSVTLLSAYIFVMHFLITFLYLSPHNPIKAAMTPVINQYTRDLFSQNWSLFAPEPLHNNTALLVKCQNNNQEESNWYNINSGLIKTLHSQPLGASARLSRIHLSAVRYYQGFADPTSELARQKVCENDPENSLCTRDDIDSQYFKEVGTEMLARVGSAACEQLNVVDSISIKEVKLRILAAPVRPFSERNNVDWKPTITGFETEWLPFEEVAPLPYKLLSEEDSS